MRRQVRPTGLVVLAGLVLALTMSVGCGGRNEQFAENQNNATSLGDQANLNARPSALGTQPLRTADTRTFQTELFRHLRVAPDLQREFRVLTTANTPNGSYLLYSLPNNDGVAFAGRQADGKIALYKAHYPLTPTDATADPVVVRAIPPNNNINPGYGVLAGRVYNPHIETIEVNYRDGRRERIDVTHTRGFVLVRKGFDTRFVQVRGFGMGGNPYWQIDTR